MNIDNCEQLSPEWWQLKKARISGTRFGNVISGRKNRLIYDLLDERLSEFLFPDDYQTEEMAFGQEMEPVACDEYSRISGIEFEKVGAIISDFAPTIHMASPDRISKDRSIILEAKCTQSGGIHIQRFYEGPESSYMPQILNYFAVSDEVKEVHWISYCPDRYERPLVIHKFTRDTVLEEATAKKPAITVQDEVIKGRTLIADIEMKLNELEETFTF